MQARTKRLPTDRLSLRQPAVQSLRVVGPADRITQAKQAMQALDFEVIPETVPWREAFAHWTDEELPGKALMGARHKEGLTQDQLAQLTGIPQRHISEMEHGKRTIGKVRAKQLAVALKVHYKVFL